MNHLGMILAACFFAGTAATELKLKCPPLYCTTPCEYGMKITRQDKCPTCDCKTESEATECQKAYAKGTKNRLLGKLILDCDKYGEYKAKQFHENNYACFNASGILIGSWVAAPEGESLLCKCKREEADANAIQPPMSGTFFPKCEATGHYKKKQCNPSSAHCWCAHQETGDQIGEKKRTFEEEITCE